MESVWFWLKEAAWQGGDPGQERLSYEGFCRVRDRLLMATPDGGQGEDSPDGKGSGNGKGGGGPGPGPARPRGGGGAAGSGSAGAGVAGGAGSRSPPRGRRSNGDGGGRRSLAGRKVLAAHFSSALFLRLSKDERGRVSALALFEFLMRLNVALRLQASWIVFRLFVNPSTPSKCIVHPNPLSIPSVHPSIPSICNIRTMQSSQVDLARYDSDGDGRLERHELRAYLRDTIPHLRPLAPLLGPRGNRAARGEDDPDDDASRDDANAAASAAASADRPPVEDASAFLEPWLDMALCKFRFYHERGGGSTRPGRMSVRELLGSPVMAELHLLKELQGDDDASLRRLVENWFSLQKSRWLRGMFAELDSDNDGLLTEEEFSRVPVCRLSNLFVSRLMQERASGRAAVEGDHEEGGGGGDDEVAFPLGSARPGAKMNLDDFLRFLLAWEGRTHPRALAYFWPVLDLSGSGRLSGADVYRLFGSVHDALREANPDAGYRAEDVKDEVFDMVKASGRIVEVVNSSDRLSTPP